MINPVVLDARKGGSESHGERNLSPIDIVA